MRIKETMIGAEEIDLGFMVGFGESIRGEEYDGL